ncbi:DUF1707 domain-containing protein [Pseudonocardia humida]|uniref:DUF1707 domain-containing protein n=1 Tax=Pseudonocardia humida TaxID=2800819 RepID=UPI00207C291C|nr:DUF1707 domain-containing protein [Pseudonocardia humida]
MSTPDPVRIGNSEREAAVRALGEHFAEGRLDPDEYEERAAAAYAARTSEDLTPLFKDLPRSEPGTAVAVPPPAQYPAVAFPTAAYPTPSARRDPDAPYGREPVTGVPYSDRHKVVAGVLQLVLPLGIGRFYTGHTGIAVAQLLLSFIGIGLLWAFIDGIVILAGRPVDQYGRPLRP